MADEKTTALTENTTPLLTDLLYVVDDPGASPASQKMTIETLLKLINVDGWIPAGETWTYASADDPTYTFTIAGVDLTTKYYPGMRLKLTQTSVKYFIVTKVAFSTDTTVTIYGGTDYDLANAAITLPYYSTAKAPAGFPLDTTKWMVEVTDTTQRAQADPVNGTWYNLGSISISIPIGAFNIYYSAHGYADDTGQALSVFSTLSTANNSESDADLTASIASFDNDSVLRSLSGQLGKHKTLVLASKTAYYLNFKVVDNGIGNLMSRNELVKLIIRAVCAYL